jgi:cytochrome c-type biogenesis protein CcmH
LLVVATALGTASPAAAQDPPTLADIEDEVMCVQCGTPLNLSTAAVADRERAFIREQIAAGKSKQEILDGLVDRFGPEVLALPEDEGFSLSIYVVPPVVIGLAAVAVVLGLRRWRLKAPAAPANAPPLRPDENERIEEELRDLDR